MNLDRMSIVGAVAAVFFAAACCDSSRSRPSTYDEVDSIPVIEPDYTGVVVPPDIAPLNFSVRRPAIGRYYIDIHDSCGRHIIIKTSGPSLRIPVKKWRAMCAANRGTTIDIDLYAWSGGRWKKYAPVRIRVAREEIDRYLVYRLIPPLYTIAGKMGIYERDISSFSERPVWLNRMSGDNCMNCHTFKNNDPEYMVAHMRTGPGNGTFVKQKDTVFKVNTATECNQPAGNAAWHPSGAVIAFSVNRICQFFHAAGNTREGIDRESDIILYTIADNTVHSVPVLASPDYMETQPEWSPDGRWLYFCRAPQFYYDSTPDCHERIFYDLMRIRYNADSSTWGACEPVLTHGQTGGSVVFPRISPNGRFLLFCLARYGTFTIFRPGGDICLLDLQSGRFCLLDVNSSEPESFPVWSSNGRWIVFASKRTDGICARLYISYFDTCGGSASKPFILPQKSGDYYDAYMMTYNVPALLKKPVGIPPRRLVRVMYDNRHIRNAGVDPEMKKWKEPASAAQVLPAVRTSH